MVEKIKEFAKKKNTNLAQIEKALGFSQGYIRKWDVQKPSYDRLFMVAKFLNIPIDALTENNSLSTDEISVIQNFRETDDIGRETIISCAEFQALRIKKNTEKTNNNELKPFA